MSRQHADRAHWPVRFDEAEKRKGSLSAYRG